MITYWLFFPILLLKITYSEAAPKINFEESHLNNISPENSKENYADTKIMKNGTKSIGRSQFKYEYDLPDGTHKIEQGWTASKDGKPIGKGFFSWHDPEGDLWKGSFEADEDGNCQQISPGTKVPGNGEISSGLVESLLG